jgi:hypothetical protein
MAVRAMAGVFARLWLDHAPDQRAGRDIPCCRNVPAHG